jgi:hypothetical protein
MSYANRYYYLACGMLMIMAAGYIFDMRTLMAEHTALRADAEKVAFKIRAAQREKQRAALHAEQSDEALISDHFTQFSRLAQRYHLDVLSAASLSGDDGSLTQAEEYQVVLSGDYNALYQFLAGSSVAEIKNIVLSPERQQRVRVGMRMRLSGEIVVHAMPVPRVINPFCGAQMPHAAKKFLREEMQFLGTVQRDGQCYKVELSPDGGVRENQCEEIS